MNRFLIETIIDKYCYHKANSLILVGIVTHYDDYIDGECMIFSSMNDVRKYIAKQIGDKSNLNMYNEFINKCCKDRINCEENISKIISTIKSSFGTSSYKYSCGGYRFIEMIKINNNNLIYHRLRTEIYKILLGNILMKICKNITLVVSGIFRGTYIDDDSSYNLINKESLCNNYITKNISADDIRICMQI
jgi:hypothetical protein